MKSTRTPSKPGRPTRKRAASGSRTSYNSEDHALAASLANDLLDRAEQQIQSYIQANERGEKIPHIPDAETKLGKIRELRRRTNDETPTWGFLLNLLTLASQLPSSKTQSRLEAGRQRKIAIQLRPRSIDALITAILKADPHISAKACYRKLEGEIGGKIVVREETKQKPGRVETHLVYLQNGEERTLSQSALASKLTRMKRKLH